MFFHDFSHFSTDFPMIFPSASPFQGYAVPGGGVVTVPLDGPVALEELEIHGMWKDHEENMEKSMEILGKSMWEIYGNPWKSWEIYGKSMWEIYGNLGKSWEIYGNLGINWDV